MVRFLPSPVCSWIHPVWFSCCSRFWFLFVLRGLFRLIPFVFVPRSVQSAVASTSTQVFTVFPSVLGSEPNHLAVPNFILSFATSLLGPRKRPFIGFSSWLLSVAVGQIWFSLLSSQPRRPDLLFRFAAGASSTRPRFPGQ